MYGNTSGLPHQHPIAHVERALTERIILQRLLKQSIVDIGGNAVR